MCCFMYRLLTALSLAVFGFSLKPQIGIGAIFDSDNYEHYNEVFYRAFSENQLLVKHNVSLQVRANHNLENIYSSMLSLCSFIENRDIKVLLVVGSQRTIHTVSQVARPLGIPILGYTTDTVIGKFVQIHNPLLLMLKPSKVDQAQAFLQFFQANFWYNIILFVQDIFVVDGFYDQIKRNSSDPKWDINAQIISERISTLDLYTLATSVLSADPKIVVIHTNFILAKRIFKIARDANLTAINHAWFVTETSYTRDHDDLEIYPGGTLSIVPNYAVHTDDVISDGTNFMIKSVISLSDKRLVVRNCQNNSFSDYQKAGEDMYRHLIKTRMNGVSGDIIFDNQGQLKSYSFVIQNLVREESQKFWRKIGHIQDDDVSPFGIIWPGESITSTIISGRKKYRIVTNPVKPFVMDEYPHSDYGSCTKDTTCIYINNTGKLAIIKALQDHESGVHNGSNPYKIKCCRGLSVDLLNRLASDLDFDYSLYIVSDTTYGKEINGSWNGMVRDLMGGTAHMAMAAFSITRPRVKVIDFTSPYFFSGFSVLYREKQRASNMRAFLDPFDVPVWFAILISATLTAIAMGIFEWNSPFGLNPWGKKRKQNYTLASGITMVYSVLFGHTVKTKSPKAWPSKVMQNFWAFSCIFIIASYTANLAAFIAGKHAGITYSSIHDSRLIDINVGVLPGSAVEGFVRKLNPRLFTKCQNHQVNTTDNAIKQLINNNLDAYLGDYPILDYARAKLDPDCALRLLTQTFGEDGYGIALPKGSPLKTPLSKKIQEYHESGYIEDLIDVHFADSQCYKQRIKQEDSRLEVQHHAGSFVMLCVGFIVGALLLLLEHAIFKWLVPVCRDMSGNSIWKSVHLMFFSQRLHRTITSAELVPAHETYREMMGIMKNRDFMKLFQKSTIKTNKMADAAKRKRLNRNFFDIVEKAKWMKEMQDNNLFGDDSSSSTPAPQITEISLRDITQAVDLTEFRKQNQENIHNFGEMFMSSVKESSVDEHETQSDQPLESDWMKTEEGSNDYSPEVSSGEPLLMENGTSDQAIHDYRNFMSCSSDTNPYTYASPVFDIDSNLETINETEDGCRHNLYGEFGQAVMPSNHKHRTISNTSNGDIFSNEYRPVQFRTQTDMHSREFDMINRKQDSSPFKRQFSIPSTTPKDSRTYHPRKRQTVHGNRRSNDKLNFNVDKFTKEELLLMWKSSELELNEKLQTAVKAKERLQTKLTALKLHMSTPV